MYKIVQDCLYQAVRFIKLSKMASVIPNVVVTRIGMAKQSSRS